MRVIFRSLFVVASAGQIGAHDQQVLAFRQAAMASAGGKDENVSGFHPEHAATSAAESCPEPAARDAEHFVSLGVPMQPIVHAVAPAIAPASRLEQRLENRGRVVVVRELYRRAMPSTS